MISFIPFTQNTEITFRKCFAINMQNMPLIILKCTSVAYFYRFFYFEIILYKELLVGPVQVSISDHVTHNMSNPREGRVVGTD